MTKRLLSTVFLWCLVTVVSYAQVGQGALSGKITDKEEGEPLPFVNVVVMSKGNQVAGASSDFDGKYTIKPLPPGVYDIKATFVGYQDIIIAGVIVKAEKTTFQDLKLTAGVQLQEVEVVHYKVPLIDKDNTSGGMTMTRDELAKMPTRSATGIAQTAGGVYSKDDGTGDLNIKGARSESNYYFIDGIKVRGSSNLPQAAIEQVTVITSGLPAQYGDVTGGVISITTRGVSRNYFGGIEYVTSGFKAGDRMIGFDQYGYNLLEYNVSGPAMFKKDSAGNKTDPIFGFFLSGNATHVQDNSPSAIGMWKVKDDVMDRIIDDPLRYATSGTGTFQNAEFLRLSDFEKVRTKQNVARKGFSLQGKLDFNLGKNANFTVGGNIDYLRRNDFIYSYSLFNSANNPVITDIDWRAFARYTQRFNSAGSEDESSANNLKNAYYSIQVDYQQNVRNEWDETHGNNFFDYGYIGTFKRNVINSYGFGVDSLTGFQGLVHETFLDTLIAFAPSDKNPIGASYTRKYYELQGWDFDNSDIENNIYIYDQDLAGENLRNTINVQTFGGLLNGDQPRNIYNTWQSPALQYNTYSNWVRNQFRVTAQGSADIKNHAISVGFEYEQRTDRYFGINPRGLWTIGRQYANNHIENLDRTNVTIDEGYAGIYNRYTYGRLNASPGDYDRSDDMEPQYFFDYNIRKELGWDTDGTDLIDFDALDPSFLKLDFFSADELLNSGNSYITYYGYDYTGKKQTKAPSFDDFFNARDEYGNHTRPVAPFSPIYIAGFIQDKFQFDDLVFNVGLRVDRFDANQSVLIDPYVFFPSVKAGEDLTSYGIENYTQPGTIGDDYVVYVDNLVNPSNVTGFRNGNTWYNAEGSEINGGASLRTANGIAPLLVDPSKTSGQDITSASFKDYFPQTNFMPRISFSFPISDEALFFAHYDVLTQRPIDNALRLNPLDYFFIESVGSNPINNPNLRPERTIDYALGFQQKLNNASSIKIEAFYREFRDMIQVLNVVDAYPRTYITYENLDFATVKGATVTYDLRRTKNLWAKVSYTLQFAEGTGSDSETALNLIRSNKPNLRTSTPLSFDQRHTIIATLDYRYSSGKEYNGPYIGERQILANTGVNLVFNTGSGTPYNRQRIATPRATLSPEQGSLDGKINGSRLPWQARIDARFDRDMKLKLREASEGKSAKALNVTVYYQILNVLNTLNINGVYRYTGNPDDDGYLVAARFQNDISQQNSEMAFREMYAMKVNSPFNYTLPRRSRLGIMINF
jgi:hypothetical protein